MLTLLTNLPIGKWFLGLFVAFIEEMVEFVDNVDCICSIKHNKKFKLSQFFHYKANNSSSIKSSANALQSNAFKLIIICVVY